MTRLLARGRATTSSNARERPSSTLRPIRWPVVLGAVVLVLAVTGLVTSWLLMEARGIPGPDGAKLRIEAIRTGMTVGAGTGGAIGLLVAVRRQWSTEVGLTLQAHHSGEQRATELYGRAAEQLASDKAPVRLAGLYALRRLAQNEPEHRQTIVDLFCAYLRMPYEPDAIEHAATRQELQVRQTAQRLLAHHLRRGDDPREPLPTFWPDTDLDLEDALLTDVDFSQCHVRRAGFNGARFEGDATFRDACFTDLAVFDSAEFEGDTSFDGAEFDGRASFEQTIFHSEASFRAARFHGGSVLELADFRHDASADAVRSALVPPAAAREGAS